MAAGGREVKQSDDKGYVLIRTHLEGPIIDYLSYLQRETPDVFVFDPDRPWVKGLLPADSHHLTLVSDIFFEHIMPANNINRPAYSAGKQLITDAIRTAVGSAYDTPAPLQITGLGVFPSPDKTYVCLHAQIGISDVLRAARSSITSILPSYICFEPWKPHVTLAYMTPDAASTIVEEFNRLPENVHQAQSNEWIFSGSIDELL